MKQNLYFLGAIFLSTLLAKAQPGANDPTFNPADVGFGFAEMANSIVFATAVQPDGKILIGGSFTTYNGKNRNSIARLNHDGSVDTSFDPGKGANGQIFDIAIQTDGKIIVAGYFSSYNDTSRAFIARINSNGSLDKTFSVGTGANGIIQTVSLQADGKIIIGGNFTTYNATTVRGIARLNANGSFDQTFNTGTGIDGGIGITSVYTTSVQTDGKIIIGGEFTSYNGITANYIARLETSGALDNTFIQGAGANGAILASTIQADGKIVIAGGFTLYNGSTKKRIARIHADGTLDTTFDPQEGADERINAITLLPDGKLLIGGSFDSYYGTSRKRVAVINANGSIHDAFNPGTGVFYEDNRQSVYATGVTDGKFIVGGFFTSYNNTSVNNLARLNATGSLDPSFIVIGTSVNFGVVQATAIQSDGKIIIGGNFQLYNGAYRKGIARLSTDGSLDDTFNPGSGVNGLIRAIIIQPDGKIIIGGDFTSYNASQANRIARLNPDGSLDNSFNLSTGANNSVYDLALQPDGKILIGGNFLNYNGTSRGRIARINTDGSLDNTFTTGVGANGTVFTVAIRQDGKIIIGGSFVSYNSESRGRIAILNTDGSLNSSYNTATGASGAITTSIIQLDGKVIIGGTFLNYNGVGSGKIARLNSDLSLDNSFSTQITGDAVWTIAVQSDGKILIGGDFTTVNTNSVNRISRLNSDGSIDKSFVSGTGANNAVYAVSIQSDGKVIAGGAFTAYNTVGRNKIARLMNSCTTAVVLPEPTLSSTGNACQGISSKLSIKTGSLSPGAEWKWYTESCGGTLAGSGAEIVVSPTVTTTYYVRAEGGCVSPGTCASIVVSYGAPTITSTSRKCTDGIVTYEATASSGTIKWYGQYKDDKSEGPSMLEPSRDTPLMSYVRALEANGCVSDFYEVPVGPPSDVAITVDGNSITANVANTEGLTYQWMDCTGHFQMPGETSQTFRYRLSSSYSVIVVQQGCHSISECVDLIYTAADKEEHDGVQVYPNPSHGQFSIDLNNKSYSDIEIKDVNGKIVYAAPASDNRSIEVKTNQPAGIYFLSLGKGANRKHIKLLID